MWRVMILMWTADEGLSPFGRLYLATQGGKATCLT